MRSLRDLRRVVTGALEKERAEKRIGSSLQAAVTIHVGGGFDIGRVDLAELCIVSEANLSSMPAPADAFTLPDVPGIAVTVSAAPGEKCQRCWRVLPEVGHVTSMRIYANAAPTRWRTCCRPFKIAFDGYDHPHPAPAKLGVASLSLRIPLPHAGEGGTHAKRGRVRGASPSRQERA